LIDRLLSHSLAAAAVPDYLKAQPTLRKLCIILKRALGAGVSLQTQELYALVFICRYLDIFTRFISV